MKSFSLPAKLFLFSTLLATAVECGSDNTNGTGGGNNEMSTVKGRVADGSGSQPQKFGGSGSISSAVKVRISQLKSDGSLNTLTEGAIQAGGSYSLSVAAGQKRLIAQCLDASGNVVASAIVEASASVGGSVTVTPMDTESSIEAEVLAKMVANGVALEEANAIDLRERINSNVAVAVKAAADADVKIKALAEAVAAAQSANVKAYAAAGVTVTQSALFDAELAAAQKLDVALDAAAAGSASVNQAYVSFHSELDASLRALDSSAKKHARAAVASSVAFRAVIKARLSTTGDAVADASLRAAASVEARVSATAVAAILAAGSAASDVNSAATNASTQLSTQISAATSAAAAVTAFSTWNTAISGGASISGSALGNYLALNATTTVTAQAAVTATAAAAAALDASLRTFTGTLTATGTIDVNVVAQTVVSAYATFHAALDLQSTALAVFGNKSQTAIDVLATASGAYRLQ